MKKITQLFIPLFIFLMLLTPVLSFAQEGWKGLVPCATDANKTPCGFKDLLTLINTVISFIFKYMAVPISAVMFAYAGFLLVTAGGEAAHARTKAKEIFTNAAFGLVLAAAAWLIVNTILSILGFEGAWIGFLT